MAELNANQERNWAMFCHLAALAVFVFPFFGNIIGPLVVWLIKKDESSYVDQQGKESLNFQISFTLYSVVAAILVIILIGILLLIALGIAWLVLVIVATIKASSGEPFRYPLTIRFIQ